MKSKTGIEAKKLKFQSQKVKTDFRKIFTVISKALVMLAVEKYDSSTKEMAGIIEAFKIAPDASDLVYNLLISSLVNAAHELISENDYRLKPLTEQEEKLIDIPEYVEFLDSLDDLIKDKEIILEYEMLKSPKRLPLIEEFKEALSSFLKLFKIPNKEAELISNRLPTYFVFALNNEWGSNYSKYDIINQKLDTPVSNAARKERQMEAYYSYLEKEAELPIFGESFSLRDIFIPLRSYYNKKDDNNQKQRIAVPLEESLDNWLDSLNSRDTIKVIQGGPGSGKSSFAKWWTAKIAKDRRIPVLFFPLHHFDVSSNIQDAIGKYFIKDSPDIPIEFDPFENAGEIDKMLLVFDGLDELTMLDKSSRDSANAFMDELHRFCSKFNRGKQHVKILVTGRPIAIQNTEDKLRESEEQILHLLPYFLSESEQNEYEDDNNILEEDQRNVWWNRFFAFKGLSHNNLPANLKNDEMDKITTEPLLNYLVALSWKTDSNQFNENTNINTIYHNLILGIHKREYDPDKHKASDSLTEKQFIKVLEEIAICAWHGGDVRITSQRKIESHIKHRGLKSLLEKYKKSTKGGVSRLLTAFYFRKYGKDETSKNKDETFEFTHKSFGEYLTAKALVGLVRKTHIMIDQHKNNEDYDIVKGWTQEDALLEWVKITGSTAINDDLYKYIINEFKIYEKAILTSWQNTFCDLAAIASNSSLPFHLKKRRSFIEERKQARNAESALLIILSGCASINNTLSNIPWIHQLSFSKWLPRLSSNNSNNDFVYECLNGINFQGTKLSFSNLSFSKLPHTNFQEVNLMFANLHHTSLLHADLKYVDLRHADLKHTNLRHADLKHANLRHANLRHAKLRHAKLRHANLQYADLKQADLQDADLQYAGLQNAGLQDADLQDADLQDADLQNADLQNANLQNANLQNADLQNADLQNALNIIFNQLLHVKSLYLTKGIPNAIRIKLEKEKPELFIKP